MGRIPKNLKQIIGKNLRAYRMRRFPGYGGSKKCAEALGVSQQQWSTWESGRRMPDEVRLIEIAAFFSVSVEDLRRESLAKTGINCRFCQSVRRQGEFSELLNCSVQLFELLLLLQRAAAEGEQEPEEVSRVFRQLLCFGRHYAFSS